MARSDNYGGKDAAAGEPKFFAARTAPQRPATAAAPALGVPVRPWRKQPRRRITPTDAGRRIVAEIAEHSPPQRAFIRSLMSAGGYPYPIAVANDHEARATTLLYHAIGQAKKAYP